jgi:hypothetical protein
MKSVYVLGPIYISGKDYLPIYKKIMRLSEKYFDKTIGTYPDFWESKESASEFWIRTYKTITKCNLFIAECSSPSHGVGMELQMAYEYNIPVIALVRDEIKGFEKSTMILGLPNLKTVIRYKNEEDLLEKIENELSKQDIE